MAYRAPSFYYYHGSRESTGIVTSPIIAGEQVSKFFDSRQGEAFAFLVTLATLKATIEVTRPEDALSDAINAVIISGHNFSGGSLNIFSAGDMLDPDHAVTEANGELIVLDLDPDTGDARIFVDIEEGASAGAVIPELTELFLTTKHTMARGPADPWQAPSRRNQEQFLNSAGVRSTLLRGAARKTYTLSWQNLETADQLILQNLQIQTSDFSQPFFFTPPDDTLPTVFVELDRDAGVVQNFLLGELRETWTLNLIEVLG